MNLTFGIEQSKFQGTPETIAVFRGYPARVRARLDDILDDAIDEGYIVATREAPRGPLLARNSGRRIVDSIERGNIVSRQGGAGGGASLERDLRANGLISPHLRYVFEGTGNKRGGEFERRIPGLSLDEASRLRSLQKRGIGTGTKEVVPGDRELRASELTRNGRYFAMRKGGEEIRYRAAVSGQAPKTSWWDEAEKAMRQRMQEGADRLFDSITNQAPTQ